MEYNIALVPGDGIGPEVVEEAVKVLHKIGEKFGHKFNFKYTIAGGAAIDQFGEPLPKETLDICKESDAIILGAVGGYKWDHMPLDKRPEKALLGLRYAFGLYANLRPAMLYKTLKDACPLKDEISDKGIDIMVVRELTGGIYFGEKGRKETEKGKCAYDTELYSEKEVKRILKTAFEIAEKRSKKVTSIDKANVLESSLFWREIVNEYAKDYPHIELNHMLADNATMQLVRDPSQFDVIVTTNMFGDLLSDEASQITGSIGLLPSASLNEDNFGMFEPIHGSAPDIAGKGIANPVAAILSAAMMLKYSFMLEEESKTIENAVEKALESGHRTKDIAGKGEKFLSTSEMGDVIAGLL